MNEQVPSKELMPQHHEALTWARNQSYGSVAARYAKLCAEAFDIASATHEPESGPMAPIACIRVGEDDTCEVLHLYAPGLPPGEHDVYPAAPSQPPRALPEPPASLGEILEWIHSMSDDAPVKNMARTALDKWEAIQARASQPPAACLHCKWPAGTRVEVEYDDCEPGEPGVIVENPEIRVRFDEDGGAMEVVFPESRLRRAP